MMQKPDVHEGNPRMRCVGEVFDKELVRTRLRVIKADALSERAGSWVRSGRRAGSDRGRMRV